MIGFKNVMIMIVLMVVFSGCAMFSGQSVKNTVCVPADNASNVTITCVVPKVSTPVTTTTIQTNPVK